MNTIIVASNTFINGFKSVSQRDLKVGSVVSLLAFATCFTYFSPFKLPAALNFSLGGITGGIAGNIYTRFSSGICALIDAQQQNKK